MRLIVADAYGRPPGFRRALIRSAVKFLPWQLDHTAAFHLAFASVSQEIFVARWAAMSPIDRVVVAVLAQGDVPRPSGDIEAGSVVGEIAVADNGDRD